MSRKTVATSVNDVLQIQLQIGELKKKIAVIAQAIATGQETFENGNGQNQAIADLLREKEDILAAQAMGEPIDKARLDDVGKQLEELFVAEESKAQEMQKALDLAVSRMAGLRRKLAPAEQELNALEEDRRKLYLDYLYTQAETEGREYAKLARPLMKKAMRIIALGKIIEKSPLNESLCPIYSGHNEKFLIPGFDLEACRGAIDGDIWRLEKVNPDKFLDEVVAMIDEIKGAGIQIPE